MGAAANVQEARKQLARSLLFLEWACKQVYGEWYGQGLRYILMWICALRATAPVALTSAPCFPILEHLIG